MDAPYTIATLPKPLDEEHGQIAVAPVYALKGSKKRKRHEVAATVDGEGISIYNVSSMAPVSTGRELTILKVQSQALVSNYAVPPQTYFCSRPCSIFCRPTINTQAQRRTYVAVKDSAKSNKRKLFCFAESVRGRKDPNREYSAPTKLECSIPSGEICSLDAVASTSGELSRLIIAYRNGRMLTVDENLSETHEERSDFAGKGAGEVECATVIDEESAKKGILKGRQDVLAALEQTGAGGVRGDLLCQILRSGLNRRFDLYHLQSRHPGLLQSATMSLRSIMSFDLPRPSTPISTRAQHDVHAASGRIYSAAEGRLMIYDLASTAPKLLTELGGQTTPIESFARLSTSLVVTTSAATAAVYETAYGSLQATGNLHVSVAAPDLSKKRKRDNNDLGETHSLPTAVSVFSALGIFVYVSGAQLVAVQLDETSMGRTQGRERPLRLTDVLSKGSQKSRRSEDEQKESEGSDWTARFNELVDMNDLEGLETLVADDQTLGRQRKPESSRRAEVVNDEGVNGDAAAIGDLWPLPELLDPTKLNRSRILYIMSRLFSYALDEPQVEIRIASRKLLEWLALTGCLNRDTLEKALHSDDRGVQREPIRPGDIMTAISETDDEFQLMHSLLSLPAQWELPEVIQALCLLIRSFDATPKSGQQMDQKLALLGPPETNGGANVANGDVPMTNGDADSHVESESKAAETELEHVERVLMSGLEVRSDTLRVILERLHAFPAEDVTRTMRTMMSQKELIFLIHMLRIELADGGWTSRYVDAGADEDRYDGVSDSKVTGMVDVIPSDGETGPSNRAVLAIGDLLNCAIDAVGTSGWLVGLSGDAFGTEDLLDSLRAEVSAGLEGCYEANTLGTFLDELDRFVASKPKRRKGNAEDDVEASLPVGGRAQPTTLKSKRTSGPKSKHAEALEKSKRVGKYSFDRIRF